MLKLFTYCAILLLLRDFESVMIAMKAVKVLY
jgi:hypothetical protein